LLHSTAIRRKRWARYDFFPGEFTDLRIRFNLDKNLPLFKPSYDITPSKDVPVIVPDGRGSLPSLCSENLGYMT
jgi:hypothetical protein